MILDRVTITGADDSIHPSALVPLSDRFPFVEWGILLSKSSEGRARFPSLKWMEELMEWAASDLALSGHLCGAWVRDLCRAGSAFAIERPTIAAQFNRFQLNFHAENHSYPGEMIVAGMRKLLPPAESLCPFQGFIFQFDDVNNGLMKVAVEAGVTAYPLFDISGGAGILPESWPKPCAAYCGYAGGLSPDNLAEQLPKIAEAAGDARVWIDVETHVRSNDDRQFDLDKVQRFLEIAAPWVTRG
jgi:hypothetical protein